MSNKPVEIEILLRETIVEGVKKAKEAIKDLDFGAKSSTANFKEQIQQQRQLIKEITGDIKALTIAAKEATSPGKKAEILGDLKGAKKALSEEQATLIGLQRQQMDANKNEEASQGGLIASLGKWAIGLATVTGAMELGKKIIESTEGASHAYEQVVASAASAVNFFFQSIASGDWSNFSSGLDIATRGAIEYVNAMEEAQRLTNQEKFINTDLEEKKQDALANTWDRSKGNRPKRMKGLQDVIDYTKQQNINKVTTLQVRYDAVLNKMSTDTGGRLKPKEAEDLIAKWSVINEKTGESIKDVKELGDEYNKLGAIKLQLPTQGAYGGSSGNVAEYEKAQKRLAELGPHAAEAGKEAAKYNLATFQAMDKVADAYERLGTAKGQVERGPIFQQRQLAQAKNETEREDEAAAKKAKEDAELDNRIKATQELMKTASGEELDNLAKKLVALEKEKKLRDDLINQALMQASDDSSALLPLNMNMGEMSMRTGGKVTSKLANKIDSKQAKNDLIDTTKKFIKDSQKEGAALSKEEIERLKEQKKQRLEILNAAMDLTYEMAKQLGLGEEEMRLLGETMDTISKAASGDYIGAAFSAMMAISDGLVKLQGDFGAAKRAEGIAKINDLLTEQNKIVQESVRFGQEDAKRTEELRLLKEKQLQLTKNQKEEEDALGKKNVLATVLGFTGLAGLLAGRLAASKQKQKLQSELDATKEEIEAVNQQIKDAEQALADLKTGGITENTLASAIAQGFQEGKTSVDDFADYMNTVLLDAANKIFSEDILADMQPLMTKVRQSLSDKKLTQEEKDAITAEAKQVADQNKALYEDLTGALDTGGTSKAGGKTADIKAITETTGSAIAGGMNSMNIKISKILENDTNSMTMLQRSLEYQQRTADNTEEMSKTLGSIDNRLSRLELDGIKVK